MWWSKKREHYLMVVTHHEAGHAVADVLQGLRLRFVQADVVGLSDLAGYAECDTPTPSQTGAYIASCYAGAHAEDILYQLHGSRLRCGSQGHDDGDLEAVDEAAQAAEELGLHYDLDAIHEYSFNLMREHWDSVQRVAGALREHRYLTGDEVGNLI